MTADVLIQPEPEKTSNLPDFGEVFCNMSDFDCNNESFFVCCGFGWYFYV